MSSLEKRFEQACATGEIPHAVLISTNKTGSFRYEIAFGPRSVREGADQSPLKLDAIMWIASCTKLMTSIAALQGVERGQLSLDAPVYDLLPELKDLEILTGFDSDGQPQLQPNATPITLKHLLTHSSGLVYDSMSPQLITWRRSRGEPLSPGTTIASRFLTPLLFAPGSGWMYGPSVDWAGKMVERANGNVSLETYMQRHIWGPLGITDMTFDLASRPDLHARLADMSKRDDATGRVKRSNAAPPYTGVTEPMGGQGVFSSATEYVKVLQSLLSDESPLLQRASIERLFSPHLTPASRAALSTVLTDPAVNNAMGGTPQDVAKDWGLGGLLTLDDVPGGRRKGTMVWGGLPNLMWWVDREGGLCGIYAGQLFPPGDEKAVRLNAVFEGEMYRRFGESQGAKL